MRVGVDMLRVAATVLALGLAAGAAQAQDTHADDGHTHGPSEGGGIDFPGGMIPLPGTVLPPLFTPGAPDGSEEDCDDDCVVPITANTVVTWTVDELYQGLIDYAGTPTAHVFEDEIVDRLRLSGSDTADLLMVWADNAVRVGNFPRAIEILDQVLVLQPGFADAWKVRATVYFNMNELESALADIERAVEVDPRHFPALGGLGTVLNKLGRKEEALAAYRQALAINPHYAGAQQSVEEIERELAGDTI
jgi:tetratricopeptide (TPR) repeat protein